MIYTSVILNIQLLYVRQHDVALRKSTQVDGLLLDSTKDVQHSK